MAKTDHPLKRLITYTITEFASWLLGAEVRTVAPLPIEQTATPDPIRSDLVFLVTLVDGRTVLLHIEFQGRTSYRPVPLRLLDYMSRLAINERPDILVSVVMYVGYGAGRHDDGRYQVAGLGEDVALSWHYQVMRLWEMEADELLELDRPALLPLVGQTHMDQPAQVLPQVVARLRKVPDREARGRLFTELLALITDEEVLAMTEQLVEREEDILIDSPYLRRIREQSLEEGIAKGREEGREEGLEQGIVKGREEGREEGREKGREEGREEGLGQGLGQGYRLALRENILDALLERFEPPVRVYRAIEKALGPINDDAMLRSLFTTVLRAATVEEVQQAVEQASAGET
jgi:predicted transposase YdaD